MDILDYIEADQDAMKELIAEFKTAESDSAHEAEAFTAIVTAMKSQLEAQTTLLTRLSDKSPGFIELTRPLIERMQGAAEVERIIECCTNRATWRASVNILCEMLETEIESERQTLLPAIFDHIDFSDRRRLGQTYRKLRGFTTARTASTAPSRSWESVWSAVINQAG